MFAWNLLLALTWMILNGEFQIQTLMAGFIIGYLVLALLVSRGLIESKTYVSKVPKVINFFFYFLNELTLANFKMAGDALKIKQNYQPGILALPLDLSTDAEIMAFSEFMTLTPGSLSLDISTDRKTLYIHVMNIDQWDSEKVKQNIKQGLEKKVQELLR